MYNPATDFVGLWRNIAGVVSKVEMPGLDYVVAALARAGLLTLSVSATAPGANQSTTAWLQAAVPSYSAEGVLRLWDPAASAYAAATPALLFKMLETAANENGVSWWATAGGPPLNTVGNNGDYAIRTDEPGGVYGPKAAGAWPANPLPGTTDIIGSTQLDQTFGTSVGAMIYRGAAVWGALPIGPANSVMVSSGAAPTWETLTALMDFLFGNARGSLLYRNAAGWTTLPPGSPSQILVTNGPGADPTWGPRTAEFTSGTTILFHQSAAPTGWTKRLDIDDYGLRVTSGSVGVHGGSGFTSVFSQTVVGNTTLSAAQMPSHVHSQVYNVISGSGSFGASGGAYNTALTATNTGSAGGDGAHSHGINLTLAYIDVIIASKN